MIDRIYWFYLQLRQGSHPSSAQYQARFEVSPSTFKRDLAFLRDRLGAPIHYTPEKKGYRLTDTSFELPAYWFDLQHLLMMLGLCRQLEPETVNGTAEVPGFRKRIEALLIAQYGKGVPALVSFSNVEWAQCDCRLVDTVLTAILDRRLVSIVYHTAYSGEISRRLVEPYRLHNYQGTWHLVGYCHQRTQPRIFMLSRIQEITPVERQFERPRFDVNAFLDNHFGIYRGGIERRVVLRFSPAGARISGDLLWHPQQQQRELADGGLELSLPVADFTEIRRHVLQYGAAVEVLAPEELRRQVAEEAARIVQLYRDKKISG